MGATVWPWGAVAGVVHFALIALAYGNRIVDRISAEAAVAKMKKILGHGRAPIAVLR